VAASILLYGTVAKSPSPLKASRIRIKHTSAPEKKDMSVFESMKMKSFGRQ
jgi:hypothetical protein